MIVYTLFISQMITIRWPRKWCSYSGNTSTSIIGLNEVSINMSSSTLNDSPVIQIFTNRKDDEIFITKLESHSELSWYEFYLYECRLWAFMYSILIENQAILLIGFKCKCESTCWANFPVVYRGIGVFSTCKRQDKTTQSSAYHQFIESQITSGERNNSKSCCWDERNTKFQAHELVGAV